MTKDGSRRDACTARIRDVDYPAVSARYGDSLEGDAYRADTLILVPTEEAGRALRRRFRAAPRGVDIEMRWAHPDLGPDSDLLEQCDCLNWIDAQKTGILRFSVRAIAHGNSRKRLATPDQIERGGR